MSSKSRKSSGKEAQVSSPKRPAEQAAAGTDESGLDIPEKYLKAPPRKMSRLSYGFLIFFLIFALVVYVGGGLGSISNLTGKDPEQMTWERPGHGRTIVHLSEFQRQADAFQKAFQIDVLLPFMLGIAKPNVEAEDVARLIVLSQLAEDQGIFITDDDLGEHLQHAVEIARLSPETYQQYVRTLGGAEYVEGTIRKALLALRFTQLCAYAGAAPTKEGIEALWNEEHEERAFDYVEVAAADFVDAAKAELPDDAALEAWLTTQGPAESRTFELAERRAIEMASFRDATSTPAAALLAAFPPKEGADPEERANDYYNRVFAKRFRKEPDGPPAPDALPQFSTLEEVREQCLAEAPIYESLQAWLADLQKRRSENTAIDFAAEAAQYGLQFASLPASTQKEIEAHPDLGGKSTADVAFFTPPDSFAYTVSVGADRLGVVRVGERIEPKLPPFAEIRDRVADRWIEVRSAALAEAKLKGMWEACEGYRPEGAAEDAPLCRRAPEETFRTAVETAGLEVAHRDWLDKGGNPGADPLEAERAHVFLAGQPEYQQLEENEVAEPRSSSDGKYVYLVRLAGKRPVPLDAMNPGQYATIKENARRRTMGRNMQALDFAYLQRTYDIVLPKREREAADEETPGEEPPAQPADVPADANQTPQGS